MDETLSASDGIDRRTMLRRAAIGGAAVVWATPVVQTLGMGVAAAETLQLAGCVGRTGKKPTLLRFTYTPTSCDPASANLTTWAPAYENNCTGTGTTCGTATISGSYGNGNDFSDVGPVTVAAGETFDFVADPDDPKGLGNTLRFTITSVCDGVTVTQQYSIHTSCSEELRQGDRYPSLTLVGGIFNSQT